MKLKIIAFLVLANATIGSAYSAPVTTSNIPQAEYREIMLVNATDVPVEIGHFYKRSKASPATFQSSGVVPAHQTMKLAVRINTQMTARTPRTNTQFTVATSDKIFTISGNNSSISVKKALG